MRGVWAGQGRARRGGFLAVGGVCSLGRGVGEAHVLGFVSGVVLGVFSGCWWVSWGSVMEEETGSTGSLAAARAQRSASRAAPGRSRQSWRRRAATGWRAGHGQPRRSAGAPAEVGGGALRLAAAKYVFPGGHEPIRNWSALSVRAGERSNNNLYP